MAPVSSVLALAVVTLNSSHAFVSHPHWESTLVMK